MIGWESERPQLSWEESCQSLLNCETNRLLLNAEQNHLVFSIIVEVIYSLKWTSSKWYQFYWRSVCRPMSEVAGGGLLQRFKVSFCIHVLSLTTICQVDHCHVKFLVCVLNIVPSCFEWEVAPPPECLRPETTLVHAGSCHHIERPTKDILRKTQPVASSLGAVFENKITWLSPM